MAALMVPVSEAALLLGLRERQVRTLLSSGKLAGARVGKAWAVWSNSIDRYQRERRGPGRPPKKRKA